MKTIKNAVFLKSESDLESFKGYGVPEIVVLGRSNVGKSSFINMLANQKKLAKTSATPGRTRLVNYFMFNNDLVLVDFPGYGYAKASKAEQGKWEEMITSYFAESEYLAGIIMLVDVRHEPTEKDEIMFRYLYSYNIPVIIIATKQDKIKRSEMPRKIMDIAAKLKVAKENIFLVSNETHYGKDKVLSKIDQLLLGFKEGGEEDEDICD
jgi:GTP-binding protein